MLFSKKKGIFSPVDGTVIPLTEVNDPVFAEKMMGDGVAVIPDNDYISSPVIGVVQTIVAQKHALGIDTVELAGEPFEILVNLGDRVDIGTPLARMDQQKIKEKGKETVVLVIVTGQSLISKKFTTRMPVKCGEELGKV